VLNIELLLINGCPHEADARALFVKALADVGARTFSVETTVIADGGREAWLCRLANDPGQRRRPFEVPGSPVGLGCRIYSTPSGSAGTPTLSGVRQALKRAADSRADG